MMRHETGMGMFKMANPGRFDRSFRASIVGEHVVKTFVLIDLIFLPRAKVAAQCSHASV